ncbi:Helix-turn-helix domain protein [Pseudovibrio axinellae]|uniref:Helix-turn-helix domain protein n=1 Tax=Pseudovibrio axinellae TaxID=989403 RepID=A0A166ASN6_9HYPH|nr:metalloregulator ArsR/SmtB family transcription factor [Pseudovibrio axinellae]KZL21501.1 Helix-turn-helix domain protein [Pseudovibrio axinellae]SER07336.1 transcriptional regulator, ArsR family [Pseudovibrio axinellae]
MSTEPRFDIIGAALADPSRSRILCEMMDGRAFTNKELACAANVTAQTASAHLKQLEAAGLTASLRSGRNVYHRISSAEVASILETLAGLSPTDHLHRAKNRNKPEVDALRARSCYNHIAGRLGVLITDQLITKGALLLQGDSASVTPEGVAFFHAIDINVLNINNTKKPAVKLCLDWTERRHHISAPLATALMDRSLEKKWLERCKASRALKITALGYEAFDRDFGISHDSLEGISLT